MRERKLGMKLKDGNMKKLFRRNQIIITTLAIMIAAAGYLNYAGKKELEASSDDMIYEAGLMEISDEDLLRENQAAGSSLTGEIEEAETMAGSEEEWLAGQQYAEIDSWDEGEDAGMENPGEAVLTSGLTVADYIANVQLSREQVRAKTKDTLLNIINHTNIEEAAKQQAIQDMIELTEIAEKENAAETLLMAKGFSDPVVSISSDKVDVVVNAASITDAQRAQIEDVVKRKAEVGADSIIITLLNLAE